MTRFSRAQYAKSNLVLSREVNNELLRKIPLNCRFNLISLRSLESPGGRECFCTLPRGAHEHASRSILFRGGGMASLSCRHGGKIGITRNAMPRHARPGHARPKQRSGIRRGRCDDAIRASIRLLLFVPAASSGAKPRHADEESRSFSINAPPSRPPLNYTRLVPSVCLPRGRRVFINLHALHCALIVRK